MTTGETLTLETLLDKDTPGAHDFRPLGLIKPILRRDRLQHLNARYAEDIAFAEDFLLHAQLIPAGFRLGLTSAPLYIYAVRRGSVSNTSTLMQTRDTQALLEVNRRRLDHHTQAISQAGASKDASPRDLRSAFRRRDQAIKWCRVVNLAKDNHA